jgi:hypothetical protein
MRDAQLAQQRLRQQLQFERSQGYDRYAPPPHNGWYPVNPDRITIVSTNRGRKILIEKEREEVGRASDGFTAMEKFFNPSRDAVICSRPAGTCC